MKRNATRREKRMTLRARGRRACACMLSLVLAIGLVPSFGIADVAQGEAGVAANVASASDDAANTGAVGMANGTDAPDSQKVAIPESSTAIDAAVIFEGNELGAASDKNGEEAGSDSAPSAARDAASAQGSSASASADAAAAQDDAATPADDPEAGPNPFKQGVDAQSLLGLDNYDKHVMVDSEGNVDKTETAKRWKTKVGCEGKKMWAGTLIQDNGYWDQPGWSFAVDWPQPNPLHDAEVYAYIEKNYSGTTDGAERDVVIAEGDAGLTSANFRDLFDGSHDVYIGDFGFEYNRLSSLSILSFVKKINMDAFMQDGTNASLTDLQFEEGIECIAGGAFTNCNGLAKQDLIEFPKSL